MPTCRSDGKARRMGRRLILALLVALLLFILLERNLSQSMLDLAYAEAYAMAVETINRAVGKIMKNGADYEDLITTRVDAQGRVTMLSANTAHMNELATMTALMAQEELGSPENQYVGIPLLAALGIRSLAGTGPRVSVRIIPIGSVNTQFVSEFESAGINQTRHRILLSIKTTVRLVVPAGSQRVDVTSSVAVAESIIVGMVPDSYVDVANQEDMLNLVPE